MDAGQVEPFASLEDRLREIPHSGGIGDNPSISITQVLLFFLIEWVFFRGGFEFSRQLLQLKTAASCEYRMVFLGQRCQKLFIRLIPLMGLVH